MPHHHLSLRFPLTTPRRPLHQTPPRCYRHHHRLRFPPTTSYHPLCRNPRRHYHHRRRQIPPTTSYHPLCRNPPHPYHHHLQVPPTSSYRPRNRLSNAQANGTSGGGTDGVQEKEVQNARAMQVLGRIKEKLTGKDFKNEHELEITAQVEKLLSEATNLENLCQHYIGWCSFW